MNDWQRFSESQELCGGTSFPTVRNRPELGYQGCKAMGMVLRAAEYYVGAVLLLSAN